MFKIIVLDKGSIIEAGTHQKLLKKRGVYFEMYEQQLAIEDSLA